MCFQFVDDVILELMVVKVLVDITRLSFGRSERVSQIDGAADDSSISDGVLLLVTDIKGRKGVMLGILGISRRVGFWKLNAS